MEKSSVAFMRQPTHPFLAYMSAPCVFANHGPTNGKIGTLKTRKNLVEGVQSERSHTKSLPLLRKRLAAFLRGFDIVGHRHQVLGEFSAVDLIALDPGTVGLLGLEGVIGFTGSTLALFVQPFSSAGPERFAEKRLAWFLREFLQLGDVTSNVVHLESVVRGHVGIAVSQLIGVLHIVERFVCLEFVEARILAVWQGGALIPGKGGGQGLEILLIASDNIQVMQRLPSRPGFLRR